MMMKTMVALVFVFSMLSISLAFSYSKDTKLWTKGRSEWLDETKENDELAFAENDRRDKRYTKENCCLVTGYVYKKKFFGGKCVKKLNIQLCDNKDLKKHINKYPTLILSKGKLYKYLDGEIPDECKGL